MADGQDGDTGEPVTGELIQAFDLTLSARIAALHGAIEVVQLMPTTRDDPAEVVLGTADRFHAWLTQDNAA